MPYLIPPRTPLTPEQVERAFDYLLALQMGGGSHVASRADADPERKLIWLLTQMPSRSWVTSLPSTKRAAAKMRLSCPPNALYESHVKRRC
ncbi:hypothetical protein ACFXEL_29760 [Streptomyces sp. NPDC059382]|uniref:hypothetical protein n=1 Tax=Streptomyces sp. NPDC059382 TaxID=3346816 RepID=UPI0036B5AC27